MTQKIKQLTKLSALLIALAFLLHSCEKDLQTTSIKEAQKLTTTQLKY